MFLIFESIFLKSLLLFRSLNRFQFSPLLLKSLDDLIKMKKTEGTKKPAASKGTPKKGKISTPASNAAKVKREA